MAVQPGDRGTSWVAIELYTADPEDPEEPPVEPPVVEPAPGGFGGFYRAARARVFGRRRPEPSLVEEREIVVRSTLPELSSSWSTKAILTTELKLPEIQVETEVGATVVLEQQIQSPDSSVHLHVTSQALERLELAQTEHEVRKRDYLEDSPDLARILEILSRDP